MAVFDHPSVHAAGTPGLHSKRGAAINPLRNYKIAHQKVSIDVDFENHSITGMTELIVIPSEPALRYVKLDCRQLEVTSVLVNNKRANFLHDDPIKNEYLEFTHKSGKDPLINDIHQHHIYKSHQKKLYSGENTEELVVLMPEKLKLSLHDPSALNTVTPSYRDSPGSFKNSIATEMIYTPVNIKIEYVLRNPKSGLHFVGNGKSSNRSDWHCYTTNSLFGASTSSWVPCIDSLTERLTWDLEISVPQTVKDIGVPKIIGSNFADVHSEVEDDSVESNDILVIGGDFSNQKESAHPIDLAKKLVTFSLFNPTSAHHVGWAAGPFIQRPLLNLKEEEQPEDQSEKDTTSVPSAVYFMPSQERNAINTTIFLYKAIDYYSREFGSFPFTSNALVFVPDLDVNYGGFTGLTIASERLLYAPNEIEPIYDSTYKLSVALSEQWSGINVVPRTYNDLWVTIGISHFMAQQFIRHLMGTNEYKYRIKKQADKICDADVGKPALASPFLDFPVSVHDLDFLALKAPIVLFILDRRMTKTDKSFGLSRVIPKIFLQAMSGDLANGSLSTDHFQHVAEKVNHNRLDPFFRQWVYGAGVPIFRVTQRFNKKRMFIEMGIRQVQQKETNDVHQPESISLISDAKREINSDGNLHVSPPLFTGPMTIRIHEADGTPYEHIVDLKEGFTKLDIQYNTKYKRLKRSQKQIKNEKEQRELAEEDDNVLLHCLGDTLQSEGEIADWELTEWSKEEEDRMTNEAFEWIRVDADFEWICKIYINQPDYMYASQLQQDRDVEAQIDSISYFSNSNPSALYSTILLRTLMDDRYYYGVRVDAALGMSKFAKESVGWIGSKHLLKAASSLFCFPNSSFPAPNNFSDFASYFIQKAIPEALSTVRDTNNNCPLEIKKVLLTFLKYNQNLTNPYSDTYYVGHLMQCVVTSILSNPLINNPGQLTDKDRHFLDDALLEISRHQKMDEWTSVSGGYISSVALTEKLRLSRRGLYKFDPEDLLIHTRPSFADDIRITAVEALFSMGALKNEIILKYFFSLITFEQSLYLKYHFIAVFVKGFGIAVIEGVSGELDEDELTKEITIDKKIGETSEGLIVIQDTVQDQFENRRDAAARTTLKGAIDILRRDYSQFKPLKKGLWDSIRNPLLGLAEKRDLFDVVSVLIPAYDTLSVRFEIPRDKKIAAINLGNGKVTLKREGVFKISIPKISAKPVATTQARSKSQINLKTAPPAPAFAKHKYKASIRKTASGPLRYVKISKAKRAIVVSSDPLRLSKRSQHAHNNTLNEKPRAKVVVRVPKKEEFHYPLPPAPDEPPKKKLTLKLNLKK